MEHTDDQDNAQTAKRVISVANALVSHKPMPGVLAREVARSLMKVGGLGVVGLYNLLNEHLGRDWIAWEPETIWTMMEGNLKESEETRVMIHALQVLVNTNYPFEIWNTFEKVAHGLNGDFIDFGTLQPVEPDVASWACKIMQAIRPGIEFDPEVISYIAICCHQAGLAYLPEELFPVGCQKQLEPLIIDHNLTLRTAAAWRKKEPDHTEVVKLQLEKLQEIKDYKGR